MNSSPRFDSKPQLLKNLEMEKEGIRGVDGTELFGGLILSLRGYL
jgi:hypothetical protein